MLHGDRRSSLRDNGQTITVELMSDMKPAAEPVGKPLSAKFPRDFRLSPRWPSWCDWGSHGPFSWPWGRSKSLRRGKRHSHSPSRAGDRAPAISFMGVKESPVPIRHPHGNRREETGVDFNRKGSIKHTKKELTHGMKCFSSETVLLPVMNLSAYPRNIG